MLGYVWKGGGSKSKRAKVTGVLMSSITVTLPTLAWMVGRQIWFQDTFTTFGVAYHT